MKVTSSRVFKLSPEYLKVFASLPVLDGDRGADVGKYKNSRNHLATLRRNIEKCPLAFEWAVAHTPEGDFRLNGSHSSFIMMEWMNEGKDITKYEVHEQTWDCVSKDEALIILAQFDNKLIIRTSSQVAKAIWSTDLEVKSSFPNYSSWGVVTAAAVLEKDGDYGNLSDLEKSELVMSDARWKTVIQWFVDNPWANKATDLRKNFGRPVVAMAYRTFTEAVDQKQWETFWNGVLNFQESKDVRGLLGAKIWNATKNPRNGKERKNAMSLIYTAWKYWLDGKHVEILRVKITPW
jgi:hypothetical protein